MLRLMKSVYRVARIIRAGRIHRARWEHFQLRKRVIDSPSFPPSDGRHSRLIRDVGRSLFERTKNIIIARLCAEKSLSRNREFQICSPAELLRTLHPPPAAWDHHDRARLKPRRVRNRFKLNLVPFIVASRIASRKPLESISRRDPAIGRRTIGDTESKRHV